VEVIPIFIGRTNELKKLTSFYETQKFEMVILYGRRRVGKTKLLTEFIKDKNAIFFVAEENNDLLNKEKFTKVVLGHYKENINVKFENWEDLFSYISSKSTDEKLIIALDEFPYIALSNPSFMSMLQNVIDHDLSNRNIMLILCGSSISFMEDELVSHKSPLYGRKTGQMKLLPLQYFDVKNLFPNYSSEEQFKVYSILGGIPHYLIQFNPNLSIDENIIRYCLNTVSLFYDEPKNLLHQELRSPTVYNAILEAIAGGASKINDISTKIGETQQKTAKYLQSLLELEIVKKSTPVDMGDSRKTLYSLGDSLFEFMYRFVYKYRSLIEQDLGEALYLSGLKDEINAFYGKQFELVCHQYILKKNQTAQLEFLVEQFGKWWGGNPESKKQEEIDIVGLSKTTALYGECKFKNEPVGIDVLKTLIERSNLIPRENRYYYIFSKTGFTSELTTEAIRQTNIRLLSLEDLYV